MLTDPVSGTSLVVEPWTGIVPSTANRATKPRQVGLTMLIDKGLGGYQTADLVDVAGDHIDLVKVAVGTAPLYPLSTLRRKIKQLHDAEVMTFPGGTLFEAAFANDRYVGLLDAVLGLGFPAIEIATDVIPLANAARAAAMRLAMERGLQVITEVGSKDPARPFLPDQVAAQVAHDVDAGASYVVVEAREAGTGVGIYDERGRVRQEIFGALLAELPPGLAQHLIWEAPLTEQQAFLIDALGPDANLGNVRPEDALVVEALRRGLRWDTLHSRIVRAASQPSL